MENKKNIIICIISSMISATIGLLIGISINIDNNNNLDKKEKDMVGTYKTSGWNGDKEVVLVLDNDYTCIHPSKGSNCKWKLSEDNTIILTVPSQEYVESSIDMYINEELSETDADLLIELIKDNSKYDADGKKGQFFGVSYLKYDKSKKLFQIYISEMNSLEEISKNLENLPNIQGLPITFSIKSIKKYVGGSYDTEEDINVRIVDGGVMAHGFFFEKIKK